MKISSISVVSGCRPTRAFLATFCLAAMTFVGAPSEGSVILRVQSVSATAGSTGNTLDVTLQNTGPGSVTIGGFSFEIAAASSTINFTSATISTMLGPYIFTGNSLFGPSIELSTGQTLLAADSFSVPASGTTVTSGATVGLGHVFFNASSMASGVIPVSFNVFPATSLSDPQGGDVRIDTLTGGTITINGSPSVPEPGTLGLAVFAMIVGYCGWGRSLRRA